MGLINTIKQEPFNIKHESEIQSSIHHGKSHYYMYNYIKTITYINTTTCTYHLLFLLYLHHFYPVFD